jgi:hypothetical protein
MPLTHPQRDELEEIFTGFVRNAFKRLGGLSLAVLAVNPFLAVLTARTPENLAEFIVHQRVERGLVTSFGMKVQKVARLIGTVMESSGVAGADLEGSDTATRRRMLMQVKSGPDTINLDIADQIRDKLNNAENRIRAGGLPPGWVVVKMLGMTYGKPEKRNSWVNRLADQGFDTDKIGRTFWEFIAGDPETYLEVFDVACTVAYNFQDEGGKTLPEAIEDAIQTLTKEIRDKYGDTEGGIDWAKLLEDNM